MKKILCKVLTFDVIVPIVGVGLESAGWMGESKENPTFSFYSLLYFFFFRLV